MEFIPSESHTIGMELELQLLNMETLDLVDGILPLMEFYPDSVYVKPEFIQNTVEVASKICHNFNEVHSHVLSLVAELETRCHALGMRLCGAGTHPFCQRLAIITPMLRYLEMEQTTGYLGHNQITFATHVHFGMSSGDQVIDMMRNLKPYLPLLIALSASSPFWRGCDTEYASYRHRILAASKSYGIPPYFSGWQEFSDFFDMSCHANIFKSVNDIHWDMRPRPHLGTLEIRVMDAQPTVARAVTLSSFIYLLVNYFLNTPEEERSTRLPHPLPWWTEKENHFQASRLGLSAGYIQNEKGSVTTIRELLEIIMDEIRPVAEQTGNTGYLDQLLAMLEEGLSYERQRKIYHETDSMEHIVMVLANELEEETATIRKTTHS